MEKSYKIPIDSNDYASIIQTLSAELEQKDSYTQKHCARVSDICMLIGKKLNLSSEDLTLLKLGGLFHDIGKIDIPDSILKKADKLSELEYNEMKTHTTLGKRFLPNSILFKNISPIIEHHHEKFDGTGYPAHLSGKNIPYLARITAIADAYDAMTSKRLYNIIRSNEDVIKEFEKCLGTQFDPEIGKVFISILNSKEDYNKILDIQKKYN